MGQILKFKNQYIGVCKCFKTIPYLTLIANENCCGDFLSVLGWVRLCKIIWKPQKKCPFSIKSRCVPVFFKNIAVPPYTSVSFPVVHRLCTIKNYIHITKVFHTVHHKLVSYFFPFLIVHFKLYFSDRVCHVEFNSVQFK